MGLRRFIGSLLGRREAPPAPLPEAEERDYALEELAEYDGSDSSKPLLIAIRGLS